MEAEDSRISGVLVITHPGLGDVQLSRGPVEGEGSGCWTGCGCAVDCAFVHLCSVEKVLELATLCAARCDHVWHGGVGQVEAGVAPRVLVGRSREDIRSMEVEVLNLPRKAME